MPTRAQIDAARRGLAVLRSMRGGAGKLAQLADFVDPGWAPPEERDELAAHLAQLRAGTPEPLAFKRVERLLRDAWGGKVADHLVELEPEPAAAASAGQVHRGKLEDGRAVAVKILHPGLEDTLRADLGNLGVLAQLATTVLPGVDPRAVAVELRERALEEMDLEHEAQSARAFARAYREHPFVHIPAPVTELSRTGVLVSEWVDGTPFAEVTALGAPERDRYGEILARFFVGSMFHTGAFHADPHPGNHRLLADGRVAFLDFGSVGRVEPKRLAGLLDAADAAEAGNAERVALDLTALGYLAEPERVGADRLLERLLATGGWLLEDRAVRIDAELAAATVETQTRAQPAAPDLVRHGRFPARDLLAGRMIVGLGSVLAQLRATARWGAFARELRGLDAEATELGVAESGFWVARGHSRSRAVHESRRAA